MNFDPGKVTVTVACAQGRVRRIAVACRRPALAPVLCGRPAEEAVRLVPLVYALCGRAQGIAAQAALAAARGETRAAKVDAAAWAEAAREHAWKLFVDWPAQLGLAPDQAFFARLVRAAPTEREGLAEALARHPLTSRLPGAAAGDAPADLLVQAIRQRLAALGDWLADRPGMAGVVTARPLAPGCGEAAAETARGRLIHRLWLDGAIVAGYEIDAPTDRCFAPEG